MKVIFRRLAENMQRDYGRIIIVFLLAWLIFASLVIGQMYGRQPGWMLVILCLLPLVVLEFAVSLILRLAYGSEYIYSLVNYFLVDHPVYGNCFRKNCFAKKTNFLIFDKFVFQKGSGRIDDIERNREARVDFNVNSLGFRGGEFLPHQRRGKLRIFCLGGSTTACDCNDDHEAWPAQLEQCLDAQGYNVEVVNAGVQGWYSYQDLLRFKQEICSYHPDIVLLHQGWNEEFEYTSLSLGTRWKPRVARNVREEHNLYCAPNRFLSSTAILSFYMAMQAFSKGFVFIPNMKFTNPDRWEALQRNEYILAWFDNLIDIARCAKSQGVLLYTIDYPGLVSIEDTVKNRDFYVENSRLTPLYADYQAVSKKKISRTLREAGKIISCLNAEEDFIQYEADRRLPLFLDEIHLSPEGNAILAQAICEKLISDTSFQRKYGHPEERFFNVFLDGAQIEKVRQRLSRNARYVDDFIENKIDKLRYSGGPRAIQRLEVPEDRYTTF